MHKIRTYADGVKVIRDRQRRKDMEKAKELVSIAFCTLAFPIGCAIIVRKLERKIAD